MTVFFNKEETNSIVSPAYERGYTGWISNNGAPTTEHLILHTQGSIDLLAPAGSITYSIDGGETWQENSEYYFVITLPSEVESVVYIKSNDDVGLTSELEIMYSSSNTNNFRGVHQWWESSRPIQLRVSDNPFYVPKVAPPNVTNMSSMFINANAFNSDISQWDVSNVTTMNSMFRDASTFNSDIANWDVSNVTDMSYMFFSASTFNSDVSQWDVSNVTDMYNMFSRANAFNGDVSQWDTSSVTNMSQVFTRATSFNSDVSQWDVSNVTDMSYMFSYASAFNQDISNWDVSKVTDMNSLFNNAWAFNSDISQWDVSNVTNMGGMFDDARAFNGDISQWDVSNVTNMGSMFARTYEFNGDISQWDVSKVTDMGNMFYNANVFNQDLSSWCVSKITSKPYDFDTDTTAWTLPKPVWGTCPSRIEGPEELGFGEHLILHTQGSIDLLAPVGSITYSIDGGETWQGNTEYGFTITLPYGVKSTVYLKSNDDVELTEPLDVRSTATNTSNFKGVHQWWESSRPIRLHVSDNSFYVPKVAPPNITNMSYMFTGARRFNSDISQWDVSNVTDMGNMFIYAGVFNSDISQWNTGKVTNMVSMFSHASAFNSDISQWDVSNVTSMGGMFYGAGLFNQDISQWDVSKVIPMSSMFYGAGAFNQDLSRWCVSKNRYKPTDFDYNTTKWTLPKPVWGTCPNPVAPVALADPVASGPKILAAPTSYGGRLTGSEISTSNITTSIKKNVHDGRLAGREIPYDALLTWSEISTSNITTSIKKNVHGIDTTVVEVSRGKIGEWGVFKMPPRNIG